MGKEDFSLERKDAQIWGDERENALKKFIEILRNWRLSMPNVMPQVLDFGLRDFYRYGLIEYWIANEETEGYCGKFLFVFNGQTCPYHHHEYKHETFFVVRGAVKMKIGEEEIDYPQGSVVILNQNIDHSFTGVGEALLLEISKPCTPGDNHFSNKKIGDNGQL